MHRYHEPISCTDIVYRYHVPITCTSYRYRVPILCTDIMSSRRLQLMVPPAIRCGRYPSLSLRHLSRTSEHHRSLAGGTTMVLYQPTHRFTHGQRAKAWTIWAYPQVSGGDGTDICLRSHRTWDENGGTVLYPHYRTLGGLLGR